MKGKCIPGPFAPRNHIQQCLHEGGIFPIPTITASYSTTLNKKKIAMDI